MNFGDMLTTLRDALATDTALTSWANTTYSNSQTVFLGVDDRNPPTDDEYPALHIYPLSRSGELCPGGDRMTIGIAIGVYDIRSYATGTNTKTLPGIAALEEGISLIKDVIMATTTGENFVNTLEITYETVDFYPYFLAEIIVTYDGTPEYGAC